MISLLEVVLHITIDGLFSDHIVAFHPERLVNNVFGPADLSDKQVKRPGMEMDFGEWVQYVMEIVDDQIEQKERTEKN